MSAEMPPPAGANEPNDKAATPRPALAEKPSDINPEKPTETPVRLVVV